ncbi:hypothetical protein BH09DEP1_BH09DEP1_4060 [soil metagenome]
MKRLGTLFALSLLVGNVLFSMGKPITVFEEEVTDLRIKKQYYFSLLPTDIKKLLKKFAKMSLDKQIAKAFYEKDYDAIEFFGAFKPYDVDAELYGRAFCYGDMAMVRFFIAQGKDLNGYHNQWGTPLHAAAFYGQGPVARLLLQAGALPNLKAECHKRNCYPLQTAAKFGHTSVVRVLLEMGADPNIGKKNSANHNALIYAAGKGNVEMVQLLLQAGADPNRLNIVPTNALYYAAINNHLQVAGLLITAGCNVNQISWPPDSALQQAAVNGHKDMVKLLLDAGADPDERGDESGWTSNDPIMNCAKKCTSPDRKEILELLLQKTKYKDAYLREFNTLSLMGRFNYFFK